MSATDPVFWFNDQFYETDLFQLSPFHSAFTVGEGIFETLRGVDEHVEALSLHLDRLQIGADLFGFDTPDEDLVRNVFIELMQRQKLTKAKLRLTLARDTLLLTAEQLPDFPESMSVVLLPYTRNENDILTGVKSTSYGQNILAQNYAKNCGADEAIFGNNSGNLCEGSCTNVFVRCDDQWFTPPLSAGPLPGVTRLLVLETAELLQIDVLEQDVPLTKLDQIDELFITSSLRGVMPVHKINQRTVTFSEEGRLLVNKYRNYVNIK